MIFSVKTRCQTATLEFDFICDLDLRYKFIACTCIIRFTGRLEDSFFAHMIIKIVIDEAETLKLIIFIGAIKYMYIIFKYVLFAIEHTCCKMYL